MKLPSFFRGRHRTPGAANAPRNRDNLAISICLLGFIFAGLVAVAIYSPTVAPTALLWAGACLGLGVTVGFLFGIPRTLQGDSDNATQAKNSGQATGSQAGYSQRVNTNLEQISDWLTKILVGLTLTQLGNIGPNLGKAANYIAPGLGSAPHGEVFAAAMIVYFVVVGFMSGYLLTRLVLAPAFWRADISTRLEKVENTTKAVSTRLEEVGNTMNDVRQLSSESRISADVTGALQFLDSGSNAADVSQNFVKKLEQDRRDSPLNRRVNIVLARLYEEKLNQRDRAIQLLNEFVAAKEAAGSRDEDTAAGYYNIACYYSLESRDAGEKKTELQRKAVAALRSAFERDRANVAQAQNPPDADLDPIRDTPEFKQLLRDFAA